MEDAALLRPRMPTASRSLLQVWPRLLEAGLSIAPGSGEVMSARDSADAGRRMVDAFRAGDYGGALSHGIEATAAAAGALPFVGMAVRGGRGIVTPFIGSRSARIRNLGFTEPGYVAQRGGEMTDVPYAPWAGGHLVASSPEEALRIAEIADAGDPGVNIMRVLVRPGEVRRVMTQDWPSGDRRARIEAEWALSPQIAEEWARGAGSVRLLPARGTGSLLVVPDQRFIRAAHARFDPAAALNPRHIDSRNLLAGIRVGGGGALPLLNLGLSEE